MLVWIIGGTWRRLSGWRAELLHGKDAWVLCLHRRCNVQDVWTVSERNRDSGGMGISGGS